MPFDTTPPSPSLHSAAKLLSCSSQHRYKSKRKYSELSSESDDVEDRPRKQLSIGHLPHDPNAGSPSCVGTDRASGDYWRGLICKTFNLIEKIDDTKLEQFLLGIPDILASRDTPEFAPKPTFAPSFSILYRAACSKNQFRARVFSDEPFLAGVDSTKIQHLSGRSEISDIKRFAERIPGICFVAIREYHCCTDNEQPNPLGQLTMMDEVIHLVSETLCGALKEFQRQEQKSTAEESVNWANIEPHSQLYQLPYWFFSRMESFDEFIDTLDGDMKEATRCLEAYLLKFRSEEYAQALRLHKSGQTTRDYIRYLLIPGTNLLLPHPEDELMDQCMKLEAWPTFKFEAIPRMRAANTGSEQEKGENESVVDLEFTVTLQLTELIFDGELKKKDVTLTFLLPWSRSNPSNQASITSLKAYPLDYATESCRRGLTSARFIVDNNSWAQMSKWQTSGDTFETVSPIEPLKDDFLPLLPPTLWAFDLQTKLWRNLAVGRFGPVQWDERAFHSLVLDGNTKDVVKALVTHRVTNSVTTDIIRGKGSGLILLLHGPPGTGKTLTAESVAEEARKPLYRVTCGDIGTAPEEVERKLTRVMALCKKWDCIVLLDEAEVFLQERCLTDLNRNALVSVFLRTLEYYDGIMILTSNRVGTFDEGFKSRIQLSLRYPKLTQVSRGKVWRNFFDRLTNDPVALAELDIEDLRKNEAALSKFELNGREIRNAINVARPLAVAEGKLLDFACLVKVIKVQQDFDKYIKDINEGLGDDEVAREGGKR